MSYATFHRTFRSRTPPPNRSYIPETCEFLLDPAVGSGAFPLGMLALLVGVRRALYRIAEVQLAPTSQFVAGWKRDFIRDCLYGVDIKREAIEIARLRLWLSLVVDADPFDMEPLPNLDYKLMVGDSLIETFDGIEIYPTRPKDLQPSLVGREEVQALIYRLHTLQDQYFQPDGQVPRDQLKRQIQDTEVAIVRSALRQRVDDENLRLDRLTKQLANVKTMSSGQKAELDTLTHTIALTQQAIAELSSDKPLPFFLYRLHFASVFEQKDGFDIVIANPPYVRHEKGNSDKQKLHEAAYPNVAHGTADAYVYFYARALQLLHEGGTLSFISSNKFFDTKYGEKLCDELKLHTMVRSLVDFGYFPVFAAAAYTCVVTADKGTPTKEHSYLAIRAGRRFQLDKIQQELTAHAIAMNQSDGIRLPCGSKKAMDLVTQLRAVGTHLNQLGRVRTYYGIKTGRSKVFVLDESTRQRLVSEDLRSDEILMPFVQGKDLGRYYIGRVKRYLIRLENGWTRQSMGTSRRLPESEAWIHLEHSYPAVARYLGLHAVSAREREDQGEYWWELRPCDYYDRIEGSKITSYRFGLQTGFAFENQGLYSNDAVYLVAPAEKWLTAVMNSSVCNICLICSCPSVGNGYSLFFVNKIDDLPIVEPSPTDQQRLSDLVDKLQALGGKGPEAAAHEREVDEIVYRTYGLTPNEIRIIEDWHAERQALLGAGKRGSAADDVDVED